ncbi:hypothetical protein FRC12_000583 [Ceratobasidium sp. 428]|nr:hypothetical protein FRC12_000583 [Ceratobasidium sp. 428]
MQDHKQTDEVSIFKLYFIWSGLGLEGSLHMTLHRHPGRFSVQYAQLLDHLEQRDIRGDGVEDLHEIVRREDQVGVVDHTPNHDKEGSAHTVELGDVQRAPAEVHDANAPDLEQGLEPHDERAAGEDARPAVDIVVHAGEGHAQQNEGEDELGDEFPHNAVLDDDQRVDQAVIDALTQVDEIQAPSSPVNETGQADPIAESTLDGDLYDDDEYADEYTELDNTSGDTSEQRRELASLPDKDYDEYEEVEEVNDLAPAGTANGELMQDGDPENYYDEYDDATKEDGNEALPSESPYLAPNSPQVVDSSPKTTLPQSPPKQPLKRNIADLENDDQKTADYPNTIVSLVDTKRAKHT